MANLPLPSEMVLAYKQYKRDTETVAGWLAEKAAQCGYKTTVSAPSQAKLKGRARKLARDAAKQAGMPKQSRSVYTIKTAEFVDMAQHIVKARPKIVLSRTIQATWQRTIRARRGFGLWFKSKCATSDLTNEKHSHFATILETALNTLKPCFEPKTKPAAAAATTAHDDLATPLKEMNNMFQHLELEDTSLGEEPTTATTTSSGRNSSVPATPRAQIEFDDKEAEDEFLFSIWSFLQDVLAVRIYVASTWQLYSAGKLELMQAACVTNLAIDLIRRAEADFETTLQRPTKYPAAQYPTGSLPLIIFKLHLPHANGGYPVEIDPDSPRAIIICGCEVCDLLLYVPWAMARSYVEVLKSDPPTFPTSNNNYSVRVPPFPNCKTIQSELFHAQNPSQWAQNELVEILPNFSMLSLMLRSAFIHDEILHAARHVIENHNVPLWVSVALQIQLDIQLLESTIHLPAFEDLKEAYALTKKKYKDHRAWCQSLGFEVWEKGRQDHVAALNEQFGDWIEGDKYGKADAEDYKRRIAEGQSMYQAVKTCKRVPLLQYFPVTCGTMKTEMQLEWHILGLQLVNRTGHMMMLCHLYNALRCIDPEAPVWPDMELVIRNQTPEKIFVGGRPKTLQESEKRMLLSMGMSSTSLAKDSRGMRYKKSNAQQRMFENAPVANNLFERWLGQESRKHDEAAYQLQELLFGQKYQQDLQDRLYAVEASDLEWAEVRSKLVPLNTKMVRTLANLSQGFMAEMPAFRFDYFSMERTCFEIYRHLNEAWLEHCDSHDKRYLEKEMKINSPVSVTMSMFSTAVRSEAAMGMLRVDKPMGPWLAKQVKSMIPESTDPEVRRDMDEVMKAMKAGSVAHLASQCFDTTQNACAKNCFKPVLVAINGLVEQGKHDFELRKLPHLVGNTAYGIFLLQHASLHNLYGDGYANAWEKLVMSDSEVRRRIQFRADNPAYYLLARCFLYRPKVINGKGRDSHVYSSREEMSMDCYRKLEASLREEAPREKESEPKADWENCGEIYGKETRRF